MRHFRPSYEVYVEMANFRRESMYGGKMQKSGLEAFLSLQVSMMFVHKTQHDNNEIRPQVPIGLNVTLASGPHPTPHSFPILNVLCCSTKSLIGTWRRQTRGIVANCPSYFTIPWIRVMPPCHFNTPWVTLKCSYQTWDSKIFSYFEGNSRDSWIPEIGKVLQGAYQQ